MLPAYVENLELTGTGDSWGTGNNTANILTGNSGRNFLEGLAGNDTLDGGAGEDTVSYASSTGSVRVNLLAGEADGDGGVACHLAVEALSALRAGQGPR